MKFHDFQDFRSRRVAPIGENHRGSTIGIVLSCMKRYVASKKKYFRIFYHVYFQQGEIMKFHDFQGFSLILVILANFMKFDILPPRNPSLYIGRAKNIFWKSFISLGNIINDQNKVSPTRGCNRSDPLSAGRNLEN